MYKEQKGKSTYVRMEKNEKFVIRMNYSDGNVNR
jgi:6-phosphogluconolactonase (cycloisomerase 2 family)